jgi:SmpB protein
MVQRLRKRHRKGTPPISRRAFSWTTGDCRLSRRLEGKGTLGRDLRISGTLGRNLPKARELSVGTSGTSGTSDLRTGTLGRDLDAGWAKVELGLAKGRKHEDRREAIAERETKREMDPAMSKKGR